MLLHRPDWVFLDEATSALDEGSQRQAMSIFDHELRSATVMSIGHRPGLEAFHSRMLHLVRTSGGARLHFGKAQDLTGAPRPWDKVRSSRSAPSPIDRAKLGFSDRPALRAVGDFRRIGRRSRNGSPLIAAKIGPRADRKRGVLTEDSLSTRQDAFAWSRTAQKLASHRRRQCARLNARPAAVFPAGRRRPRGAGYLSEQAFC